tara:strand:- start:136 stop:573 length:438 start_codon:yes stop_codon:yes gene_type:complete
MNNFVLQKQKNDAKRIQTADQYKAEQKAIELEIVQDPKEAEYRIKDYEIAKTIGAELCGIYPGHGWTIEADSRNGIAKICNKHMGFNAGYVYKLHDIEFSTFKRDMMRIGGDILERYKLSRSRMIEDEVRSIARDLRGNAKVDLS